MRTYDFLKQQEIINEALILLCMEELRTVRIKKKQMLQSII